MAHGKVLLPVVVEATVWVNGDVRDRDDEIVHDVRPHLNVLIVAIGSEPKAPNHLEESQMCAVADQVEIVGANAILDISVRRSVWCLEFRFEWLHPRADEERGWVVFGDNVFRNFERETVLVESTA